MIKLNQFRHRVKLLLYEEPVTLASAAVVDGRDQAGPGLVGLWRNGHGEGVAAWLRHRIPDAERARRLAAEKLDHALAVQVRAVPRVPPQVSAANGSPGPEDALLVDEREACELVLLDDRHVLRVDRGERDRLRRELIVKQLRLLGVLDLRLVRRLDLPVGQLDPVDALEEDVRLDVRLAVGAAA